VRQLRALFGGRDEQTGSLIFRTAAAVVRLAPAVLAAEPDPPLVGAVGELELDPDEALFVADGRLDVAAFSPIPGNPDSSAAQERILLDETRIAGLLAGADGAVDIPDTGYLRVLTPAGQS
jgi:hypothetical protein